MNYLYAALGAIVLLAADFFAGYHFGTLAPKLAAAKTELKQEAAQEVKATKDQAIIAEEAKTYEAATDPLKPIAAPHLSVCYYAPLARVPSALPAGSGVNAGSAVRAPDTPNPVPGPDIGRPLVQIGHNADAQLAGLRDYIEHVCQGGK